MKNGYSDRKVASEAGKKSKRGKSEKTKQWELLGERITNKYTERVFKYLDTIKDDAKFMVAYMNLLEYFKPKLNRTDLTNDGEKFDFSVLNDAELINELNGIRKLIAGTKGKDK